MNIIVRCPSCSAAMSVPQERVGQRGRCGKCGHIFVSELPEGQGLEPGPKAGNPPAQVARPVARAIASPPPAPASESENPFGGFDSGSAKDESEAPSPRRKPKAEPDDEPETRAPRKRSKAAPNDEPEGKASSRKTLIVLGSVIALGLVLMLGVGGFFLVRYLNDDRNPTNPKDVDVAAKPTRDSLPKGNPKSTPTKAEPKPAPQPSTPAAPFQPVDATMLRLDGNIASLTTAGEGRFVVFHVPTRQQLVIYDAAAKTTVKIPDVDQTIVMAGGRNHVFVAQRINSKLFKYDLRTGEEKGVITVPGGDPVAHLAIGSAADGPLVVVTAGPGPNRVHARLYDPETMEQISIPINDPARSTSKAFPLKMSVGPGHVGVSADGGTITLSDRMYTRTESGYTAVEVNPSSGLHPIGDGSLAVGNHIFKPGTRSVKMPDRVVNWAIPAANGNFFIVADSVKGVRRLALFTDPAGKVLADLPADVKGGPTSSNAGLNRRYAFLPDLGIVVSTASGTNEVTISPVDMLAVVANADKDILFTTVPPAACAKGRPYTYTPGAIARDGTRPAFVLEAGPPGMAISPEGQLSWDPGATFAQPYAEVQVVAQTANGAKELQKFRVLMPGKNDLVAVAPPTNPSNPTNPPVVRPPVVRPPVTPTNPVTPPVKPEEPPPAPTVAFEEVKLPGAVSAVAVGGAGRFVCLLIPSLKQVAVFDSNAGKVVKYLPLGGENSLIAATMDKLFVLQADDSVIQRWDLKTLEKEVTAPLAVKQKIKTMVAGSASAGPLWLIDGSDRFSNELTLLDPLTLRAIELKKDPNFRGHQIGEGVRVSADGRTLGTWKFATSPSGLTVIRLVDATLKAANEHDSVGHVTPGPDGRVIHTAVGRFTAECKVLGERDGKGGTGPRGGMYSFPAVQGTSLYVNAQITSRVNPIKTTALAVHWAADGQKLADLPTVTVGEITQWDREAIGNDQRLMLFPASKSLVVLPSTNDRLLVYPFDLDATLEKTGKDYLLVEAPLGVATRGQVFAEALTIKSKKGGVKVKLDSGPAGLTVSNEGKIAWAVPKDFAENEASVILTVSDASGQESLQSMRVSVRGEKVTTGAVAPPMPPMPPVVPPKKEGTPEAPIAPKDSTVTVKLPGAARAVCVGAGGKIIALNIPQQKQIALLDVAQGKVVKYLPTAESDVFIAAGQEHLFVANPTAKVIQRYNLKTFEKEATVQQPIDGAMAGLAMGSASKGPLLVCPKGDNWGTKPSLVDPIKMKVLPGSEKLPTASPQFIRVSANGRLFGWRNSVGSEGHDMTLVEFIDGTPKARTFGSGTSLLLPSPDGRYVYCGEGVFNAQFKKLHPVEPNRLDKPFLPAASGNLFMQLEIGDGGRFPGDPMATQKPGRVNFFLPGQYRPFGSIDKVEGLAGESYAYGGVRDPIMHDGRIHLCPEAGRLVTIPMSNDKLVLHPFDLETLLKSSDTDYLLVTSEPPFEVGRGTQFSYTPVVRSRKGGTKLTLSSGPAGMKLAGGKLEWRVPADLAEKEVDVILTVSDATGQEVFQTFKVTVRDPEKDEKIVPEPKKPEGEAPVGEPSQTPSDLTIKPAALTKDEQSVNLPSTASAVVPAAGGRLLLIHLPKQRKIAVFDTAEARILKYLPLAEDDAMFAAGREKLIVFLPGANVLQRWDLKKLEREATVPNPVDGPVKSLAMGSATPGPLVVLTKATPDAADAPKLLFFNPETFKESEYGFDEADKVPFRPQPLAELHVSANGDLITVSDTLQAYIWSRKGKKYKGAQQREVWRAIPTAEGQTVYAGNKILTPDGKKLNVTPKGIPVPALQGSLVLYLEGSTDPFGRDKKAIRSSVYMERDSRPLIQLTELNGLTADALTAHQRVFLLPESKLLASLSESGDKLILHRFDLDQMMEKTGVDYLYVTSRSPALAVRGETFKHTVRVKSRKGGVKFTLDAGPKGMRVDADGAIVWDVPKDFEEDSVSVILTVTDKSGQETLHTFTMPVQDASNMK